MIEYNSAKNLSAQENEYFYANLTAGTALIKTGNGALGGITINSHTSGTILIKDGTTAAGNIICGTMTFAAAERDIELRGMKFSTGCFVTVGGTADITVQYK
jgi:hypothetical protein